jgi:adenine-specific DNA methylase
MTDRPRLIEVAFPLKQASLDSVHEKNVRHGHISTLHIWPARRPLAACRAALIATLLPDPGTPEKRKEILEKLAGRVIETVEKKKLPSGKVVDRIKEETVGGILHWGRESSPDLQWFREEIRKAYGGRAPKVLDPFAGGGAIPLEAMRLGCEVTAIDINPVAWFILRCTLEYPQKLAGQKRRLPDFILKDREFMEAFFKSQGLKGARLRTQLQKLGLVPRAGTEQALPGLSEPILDADLAWHVRAWGKWVLNHARAELAKFYPTYADFEPLDKEHNKWERRQMRLVPTRPDGTLDLHALNAEFDEEYLKDEGNPRWVPRPTVAYLWARTVTCKNCRATVPLLKTRWLCKKDNKRVLLTMEPNAERTGVVFGVQNHVPVVGGNPAQRREHDKRVGQGTMSRNGAWCPCCGQPGTVAMKMEDIQQEGRAGGLRSAMTVVVVGGQDCKEYRLPTPEELRVAAEAEVAADKLACELPFGMLSERIVENAKRDTWCVQYGVDEFRRLFTSRQLLAMGAFAKAVLDARREMAKVGYSSEWIEGIGVYLSLSVDRLADFMSTGVTWTPGGEFLRGTFVRFALPIMWDFCEGNPTADGSGNYAGAIDWIARAVEHTLRATQSATAPTCFCASATKPLPTNRFDVVVTDPPYYDSIGYSVLMDFFYVWLRRSSHRLSEAVDAAFHEQPGPRWNSPKNDGELVDDASRFGGDRAKSKAAYEVGMLSAFEVCLASLTPDGRLVVVFANKQPEAWEVLVAAIIRAGFVVDGSWPIMTERLARTRSLSSAALASSVWLVCKKRPELAGPGWDNTVLAEMVERIQARLREFWDAGIRGPDFVWAATGPALEAYSKYPIVKKANDHGKLMEVSEFLTHVRRIVVDFVVGRILSRDGKAEVAAGLDGMTTYYLLHRHDFGMDDAPAGACILYAISCNLSDSALADHYEILTRSGGLAAAEEEEEPEIIAEDTGETTTEGTGSTFRLRPWHQRNSKSLGHDAGGRPAPLIDQIHRVMHLWKAGDQAKVDEYLDEKGLRRNQLFHKVLQALIELSQPGGTERSLLESISNHVAATGPSAEPAQYTLVGIADREHNQGGESDL